MLFHSLGELVGAGGRIQNVVIVAGIFRIQSCIQAVKTRIGDGCGNQTCVDTGIVGAVDSQIVGSQFFFMLTQCVKDGSVDAQIAFVNLILGQTVIDNGSDGFAFRGAGGFFFNQRSDDDQILHAQLIFLDIAVGAAVVAHHSGKAIVQRCQLCQGFLLLNSGLEAQQHFTQRLTGRGAGIEVVGIGEEVTFQTVLIAALNAFQEPEVLEFAVGRVLFQIRGGADALFFQQGKNLAAVVAFGNQNILDNLTEGGVGGHAVDDGMVVIHGIQGEGAGGDFAFVHGDAGLELEISVFGVVVIVFTLVPKVNIIEMPKKSQLDILERYLVKNEMLSNGEIITNPDVDEKDKERIVSAYRYLKYEAAGKMPDWFENSRDKDIQEVLGFDNYYDRNMHISCHYSSGEFVDVSEYTKMYKRNLSFDREDMKINFDIEGKTYSYDAFEIAKEMYETYGTNNDNIKPVELDENTTMYIENAWFDFSNEFSKLEYFDLNTYILIK